MERSLASYEPRGIPPSAAVTTPPKKPSAAPHKIAGSRIVLPHIPGAGRLSADDTHKTTNNPRKLPATVQPAILASVESSGRGSIPPILLPPENAPPEKRPASCDRGDNQTKRAFRHRPYEPHSGQDLQGTVDTRARPQPAAATSPSARSPAFGGGSAWIAKRTLRLRATPPLAGALPTPVNGSASR